MHSRLVVSLIALTLSAALIGIRITGRLWPVLPGAFAMGAVVMALAAHRCGPSGVWLVGACGLLITHTTITILHPATLSGIDPDTFAVYITQVTNSGTLSMADSAMYRALPVFLLFVASVSELTSWSASTALIGITLAFSILIPLISAWFTAILIDCRHTDQPAISAALGSTVMTMTVSNGYTPIPMTLGFVTLLVAVIVSGRYLIYRNATDFIVLAVLGVAIVLSHKFLALVLLSVLVAQTIAFFFSGDQSNSMALPLLGFIVLGIQWAFLTTFGAGATFSLLNILGSQGPQAEVIETVATTASRPALSRELGIISRRGHAIVLLPLAGISWLLLAKVAYFHPRKRRLLFVLGTGAALTAFIPLSVMFPSELRYTRTIPVAEPLFVTLIVGAGWLTYDRARDRTRTYARVAFSLLAILTGLVIIAQVGSAPISADHPADYRAYLTENELAAKEWGHQYGPESISADPFYAHERPTPSNHVGPAGWIREEREQRYQPMLEPYTNRSLLDSCPESILYRNIEVYRSPRSQILTWDPRTTLDQAYSRVFDNGKAQQFHQPSCL